MKDKNHVAISVDTWIWQNQAFFHNCQQVKDKRKVSQPNKGHIWNTISEKKLLFIPTSWIRQRYLSSSHSTKYPCQKDCASKKKCHSHNTGSL